MKETIRWHLSIPVTDNPHNLGEIKKDDQGEYVLYLDHFNEVEKLQARIKELEYDIERNYLINDAILNKLSTSDNLMLIGEIAKIRLKMASSKHINEIKAQGIDEFSLRHESKLTFGALKMLNDYAKKLMTKHD